MLSCVLAALLVSFQAHDGVKDLADARKLCRETTALDMQSLRRTQVFRYIMSHLDECIQDRSITATVLGSEAVWHAAFLFGSDEQIQRAFESCWAHTGVSGIPQDLATAGVTRCRTMLLHGSKTSDAALCVFLNELLQRDPARWGAIDYVPDLERLLGSDRSVAVRSRAAECLFVWRADTEEGIRALQFLDGAARENPEARAALEHGRNFRAASPRLRCSVCNRLLPNTAEP